MEKSKLLKLDGKDFLRGLLLAVGSACVMGLNQLLTTGAGFTRENIGAVVTAGISAGLLYLSKNLFTNSEDKFLKKELKK
jgi:hypothetical protein